MKMLPQTGTFTSTERAHKAAAFTDGVHDWRLNMSDNSMCLLRPVFQMDWHQQRRNNLDLLPESVKGFVQPGGKRAYVMMINVGTGYVVTMKPTLYTAVRVRYARRELGQRRRRLAISRSLSIAPPDLLTRRHPP